MRRMILVLALAGAYAGSAYATAVTGTFDISGTMTASSSSISWLDGQAAVSSGATGSFVGASGLLVMLDGWNAALEPVGNSPFAPQAFLSFPSALSLPSLSIDSVLPGVFTAAECTDEPAATGQTCTPSGSMFSFLNSPVGSSLQFVFQGVTSDGDSSWTGNFTAQFNVPYQTELTALAAGSFTTSYSATFAVTPTIKSVPEPASLALFAAGLAAAAAAAAIRRRRSAN